MTNEQIDLMILLITKINTSLSKDNTEAEFEYHSGKNYYTIKLKMTSGNSEYRDYVVFYPDDGFDEQQITEDLNNIMSKAESLFNH